MQISSISFPWQVYLALKIEMLTALLTELEQRSKMKMTPATELDRRLSDPLAWFRKSPPLILCCFVICEIVIAFSVLCSLLLCFCFFVTVRVANGENGLFPALFHYISK